MSTLPRSVGVAALSALVSVSSGASATTLANPGTLSLDSTSPVAARTGASVSVDANPFDIVVNFIGGLTASQQGIFSGAESFWETRITGNRYDLTLTALQIDAEGVGIDGVGGVLGQAGPNTAVQTNGQPQDYAYASSGSMQFDTADLGALEGAGALFDVIVHEMAHVIGFGTLWNPAALNPVFGGTQNVYTDGSGQYTGAYALGTYNSEFGLTETSVPVELGGGPGTANAHWNQTVPGETSDTVPIFAGGQRDLMTGFIGGPFGGADAPLVSTTLSDTTIASFADIGYRTIVTDPVAPIPLPAAALMLLTALGALGLTGRRGGRAAA